MRVEEIEKRFSEISRDAGVYSERDVEIKLVFPLLQELGYEASQIKFDCGITAGTARLRADAIVETDMGAPHIVVEVKRPDSSFPKGIKQLIDYRRLLKAPFGLLTNGKKVMIIDQDDKEVSDLPFWSEKTKKLGKERGEKVDLSKPIVGEKKQFFLAVCDPKIRKDKQGKTPESVGVYKWFLEEYEWGVSAQNPVALKNIEKINPGDRVLFYLKNPTKKVIAEHESRSSVINRRGDPNYKGDEWPLWIKIDPVMVAYEGKGVPFSELPQRVRNRIRHSFFSLEQEEYENIVAKL